VGKQNETSTHSYLRTRLLPKLKSSQDLTIRIETKVAEEAVDGITLGVDGGAQFLLNSCVLLERVSIHPIPSTARSAWSAP
jgi:hypothetical protein